MALSPILTAALVGTTIIPDAPLFKVPAGGVIACIGDSTVAGVATGGGTSQVANSWPTQLAALLNATGTKATAQNRYGCASGTWANLLSMDGRVSSVATWTQTGTLSPGGNSFGSSTAGDSATFNMGVCTKIVIEWQDNAAGRVFTYAIDGGAAVDVPTTGNYLVRRTTITVPQGQHSITLAQKTAACNIRGVEAWDDTNGMPVRVLNLGISGATSTQLANDSGTEDSRLLGYKKFQPDLSLIEGGIINDAVNAISPATTKANLQAMANACLTSKAGARVAFVTPNPIGDNSTIRAALDAAVAVMRQLGAEMGIPVIDVFKEMGSYEASLASLSDARHPNTAGYGLISRINNRYITVAN